MSRTDFSQPGQRPPTKGFRTKKARRAAIERQRVHKAREEQAKKWKAAARRKRSRRGDEGWWPPVTGRMSPASHAGETSYREKERRG